MDNFILSFSAIFLYFACSALLFIRISKARRQGPENTIALSRKQILAIGFAGFLLHMLLLYSSIHTATGINLGFDNIKSLVAALSVLFALIAAWRHPVEILAILLLPMAVLFMLFDFGGRSFHLVEADSSAALVFHILTSIIAYSLLALAALQAILLSVQNRFLRAHQPGGLIKLMPPLKNMEVILFEVVLIGFIVLTISLGSGLIFLDNMFAQHLAHKTILSILAWLVFLTLLIGHWRLGWRGRTAVHWTLTGFVSLMLAYFGSKFVMEILLT